MPYFELKLSMMFSIFRKTPLLALTLLSRDKMPSNFMNSWIFLTAALSSLIPAAVGIRCLECNELPDGAARSQCPGAALINFGAKFDVSNECVRSTGEKDLRIGSC